MQVSLVRIEPEAGTPSVVWRLECRCFRIDGIDYCNICDSSRLPQNHRLGCLAKAVRLPRREELLPIRIPGVGLVRCGLCPLLRL